MSLPNGVYNVLDLQIEKAFTLNKWLYKLRFKVSDISLSESRKIFWVPLKCKWGRLLELRAAANNNDSIYDLYLNTIPSITKVVDTTAFLTDIVSKVYYTARSIDTFLYGTEINKQFGIFFIIDNVRNASIGQMDVILIYEDLDSRGYQYEN